MEEFINAFNALAENISEKVDAMMESRFAELKEELTRIAGKTPDQPKEITGNNELAELLGVSAGSIGRWKRMGLLQPAIVAEYGRTIIYNVEKAKECLKMGPERPGRKRKFN